MHQRGGRGNLLSLSTVLLLATGALDLHREGTCGWVLVGGSRSFSPPFPLSKKVALENIVIVAIFVVIVIITINPQGTTRGP